VAASALVAAARLPLAQPVPLHLAVSCPAVSRLLLVAQLAVQIAVHSSTGACVRSGSSSFVLCWCFFGTATSQPKSSGGVSLGAVGGGFVLLIHCWMIGQYKLTANNINALALNQPCDDHTSNSQVDECNLP
jgi:hypothetical protein